MMELIIKALVAVTPLEWFANLMTVVCIVLAGRNNIHTWWTGIVACIAFGVLFFDAKLYADVTLQVFFVVTGFIGWFNWLVQNKMRSVKTEAPPEDAAAPFMYKALLGGTVAAICYGALLHAFTDAYAPFVDSFVLMLSVLAQFLLMRRYVQTWPVWVVVNILSVPLYASKELYVTSFLYACFLINAIISWMHWRKLKG